MGVEAITDSILIQEDQGSLGSLPTLPSSTRSSVLLESLCSRISAEQSPSRRPHAQPASLTDKDEIDSQPMVQVSAPPSKMEVLLNNNWFWEAGCIIVALACMMAVVIILVRTSDILLGDWKLPIQPNSLVSIFITVAKAALLLPVSECISQAKWIQLRRGLCPLIKIQEYDEASRGPWGSLQLLFTMHKSDWIAALGAALTIISMALDPFAQQIIAYPSRQVTSDTGSAQLAATQILDTIANVTMQGAVLNGIYLSNLASSTYTCTTPTCIWPQSVISLGVCSACRDLSSSINATCNSSPGPLMPADDETWTFKSTNCSYAVNQNITFDTYLQTITFPAANSRPAEYASQWTKIKLFAPSVEMGLGSLISADTTFLATIISYTTFFDQDQPGQPDLTPGILAPEIIACGLYWCGQVYTNASVVNGSIHNFDPVATSRLDLNYYPNGEDVYLQTDNGRCDILSVPEDNVHAFPEDARLFAVSPSSANRLAKFISTLFNITLLNGYEQFPVFPDEEVGLYGLADAIFKEKDLALTFQRIAASMTEQVRTSSSSYRVPGLAITNETYVRVRWEWMVLPLAVLLLSAINLCITILANRNEGAPVWKASSIALFFHRLEGWDSKSLKKTDVAYMNRAAEEMKGMLEKDGGSDWKFSQHVS